MPVRSLGLLFFNLGVSELLETELDNDMISHPSINQRWKNPKVRGECRAAYRFVISGFACPLPESDDTLMHRKACGEMESKTDADGDGEQEEVNTANT